VGTSHRNWWGQVTGIGGDKSPEYAFKISNVITWKKPNPSPSYADYQMQSEFCLYFWLNGNGAHKWYGGKNETNVWEVGRDSASHLIHPTQKPIELARRALINSSRKGNVVMDLFLGSGSTLIAAEKLKRKCYGIEIDPRYCDAIVKRYIKCFGKGSVLEDVRNKYLGVNENVI
jgi:DNA modification methylase